MDTTHDETPQAPAERPAPLPVSVRDRHAFTPRQLYSADGSLPDEAAVYLLKYPTLLDSQLLERELKRRGMPMIWEAEVRKGALEAAAVLAADAERDALQESIRRCHELEDKLRAQAMSEADMAELVRIAPGVEAFLRQAIREYPVFAETVAEYETRFSARILLAAALYLDGVTTAGDTEYAAVRKLPRNGRGFVSDEALAAVPEAHRYPIGIQGLLIERPTAAQKKS